VVAVDRATGEVTWKWGGARHQHSPVEAANGNILVFDNGVHRSNVPRSRVVEVERESGKVAWSYEGDPPESFFSWNVSNAEELANGNVLVSEGAAGRVFEVTRDGDVAWEWISPYRGKIAGRTSALLFRAHRYGPEFPGLAGKELRAEG
jgi:outer membrane protein assembly factor BamB